MRAVVDVVQLDLGLKDGKPHSSPSSMMDILTGYGFHVIPQAIYNPYNTKMYNYINYYTDARYTVWETEGEYGDTSYLQYDSNIMDDSSYFIKLKPEAACGEKELMWGPYYAQYVYETNNDLSIDTTYYLPIFRLKLDINPNPIFCEDTTIWFDNPETPICIIQVTQSKLKYPNDWTFECTHPIREEIITLNRFQSLGQFEDITFLAPSEYNLLSNACQSEELGQPHPQYNTENIDLNTREIDLLKQRSYIEFKVIWLGNPNYLLSIDKVTVSDVKGREIMSTTSSIAEDNIQAQLEQVQNYNSYILGWFGRDEPSSIDQYAPIKRVIEIINNKTGGQNPLWLALMGMWDGAYGNRKDPNGTYHLFPWQEMKKRIGNMNVWQDYYLYDYPCDESAVINYPGVCYDDWRSLNIWRMAKLNYKPAYELDPNFGISLQCGEVHYENIAEERNIEPHELLYNTNVALMYGAKFLSLYSYFAQRSTDSCMSGWICHAIVDIDSVDGHLIYTPKYTMLKNTIKPRLNGLMGKTLKKLIPFADSLGKNPSTSYSLNFNRIKKVKLANYNGSEAVNSLIEIGTFKMPEDNTDDYFMIINRYYSSPLYNQFYINLHNLCDYKNWNLFNYVDTTGIILLPNIDGEVSSPNYTIQIGDAILYSIKPVVEFGGKLLVNETVNSGTTLNNDMTIENGATLTVNGTYYAKANITVKNGGKIKYGTDNSKIVFTNGAGLVLEGNSSVLGLSNTSRLSLEFNSSTNIGVVVNPVASSTISYCNITGPQNGISVENEASINISNTTISNCTNTGIALFHFGNAESPVIMNTPYIYKCNITNCGTGIRVFNSTEVIIKQNTITQCNLGLHFNMVSSAYISWNTISGLQSASGSPMPGILMCSSGGYLRNNTIRYHNYGVSLAYSSPDMGINTIENNYICGIYSSLGSYPNLVLQLASNNHCWYLIGGCNVIRNNGIPIQSPPPFVPSLNPDGAEIFLTDADVLLSNGFNNISDDRTNIPPYLTTPLITGKRNVEGFNIINNYWGVVGPSPERFGSLMPVYEPTANYCDISVPDVLCDDLLISTTAGQIVDTIGARERESSEIGALEENYAIADKLFYGGEIEASKTYYLTIIQGNYTNTEKLYAYNKLYEIGELLKEGESYFTNLQNAYTSILEIETDTLLLKALTQKSILCDVSKGEYITAINKFDNIIQQNPNSEAAVYAEIDILTTSLNLDTTNTQLGKISGGKYLVKGTSDYLSRLDEILQSRFGVNSGEGEKIIPDEYSLEQNYPNPFNPTTTIRYDLPKDGLVQLEVFDIIGRKITTLVNTHQSAGRYEVNFDASKLASGVYIYKLQSGEYTSSKKMMLLK
ncbi:MAG: right-handed parallel beta-helix repeat-containing protein [Ignavibacteriaceae bacterium]|jgi:tetratricopeptide (TPR) repeat protein|nr:right-handed parallel beta-helix repeat-containing protein [Ignavibacteriaceae bacterium]